MDEGREEIATMRGLTLTQPWASLVAGGSKRYETRSWRTKHTGLIAIHAAKGFPKAAQQRAAEEVSLGRIPRRLPFSAVVAVARLVECRPTEVVAPRISGLERYVGDYAPGRFAWKLDGIRALREPVFCKGALGLWRMSTELESLVLEQAAEPSHVV